HPEAIVPQPEDERDEGAGEERDRVPLEGGRGQEPRGSPAPERAYEHHRAAEQRGRRGVELAGRGAIEEAGRPRQSGAEGCEREGEDEGDEEGGRERHHVGRAPPYAVASRAGRGGVCWSCRWRIVSWRSWSRVTSGR